MTQQSNRPPSLAEIYANREPNELEKRLAEQKAHPSAYEYERAISHMRRTDPRRMAATRALINGETPDYERIWKEHSPQ